MLRRLVTAGTAVATGVVVLMAGHLIGGIWPLRMPAGAWIVTEASAAEPDLKAGMIDPKTGKKIKYWVAPMDPTYIRKEPGKSPMGMDMVPVYEDEGDEKEPASSIRIDPATMQNMGVRLGRVQRKSLTRDIRTIGNITYDETRIYTVNTKFDGWIDRLYVDYVGETVKKGQRLFDLYSPQLVTAQEEYLLARDQFAEFSQSPYADMRDNARRLFEASKTRLRYWDLTATQIAELERSGQVRKNLTIYSPAGGVVTLKNAFEGHYVKAGEHQYEITDLSVIWVDVDVYEYELPWVRKGMPAAMELAYIPGKRFAGKVLFIYPYIDTKTRTVKLRLQFANPGLELKPGMYANIFLTPRVAEDTLVIPQEAVIDSGVRKVVFVSLGNGHFQPRDVRLGAEGNQNEYQVLDGLKEGEEIVLSAQFMLDSESRLREAIQKMLEPQKPVPAENAHTGSPAPPPGKLQPQTHEGHSTDHGGLKEQKMPSAGAPAPAPEKVAPADHSGHGASK